MTNSFTIYNEASSFPLIITAEHGGNDWPKEMKKPDFPPSWQSDHSCYDVGTARLAETLASHLECTALIGNYSRLLVDLNREEDDSDLIAIQSDGFYFQDNEFLSLNERQKRIEQYYHPFQEILSNMLLNKTTQPVLLSLHSFTKRLRLQPMERPWDIGVLFAKPNHFSNHLIEKLNGLDDICLGVNEPYDLQKVKGGTVRFHADKYGFKNAELEIQNDWFEDLEAGVQFWLQKLLPILNEYFKQPSPSISARRA